MFMLSEYVIKTSHDNLDPAVVVEVPGNGVSI